MENVLERKLSNQAVGRSPLQEIDLIGENFGRVLEDGLRPLLKTNAGALILDCDITKLADVSENIPVPAMLGLVEIENSESMALINVSTDLVYHIVDMRMGGDPTNAPIPTTRSFTGIDVSLCMDFFQIVLDSFSKAIFESLGVPLSEKLSVAGHKQDITTVRIAAKTADVLQLTVSLDIGEAARSGDFDFIIPLAILDVFKASTQKAADTLEFIPRDLWYEQMTQSAASAQMIVHAILDKPKMSLSKVEALEVGQVIELSSDGSNSVDLMINLGQAEEFELGKARLGAFEGNKVIKMDGAPDTSLLTYLNRNLKLA